MSSALHCSSSEAFFLSFFLSFFVSFLNQGLGMTDLPCSFGEIPPLLRRTMNTWSHSGASLFMTAKCGHSWEAVTAWWWFNPRHPFTEHPHTTLLQMYNIWVSFDVFRLRLVIKKDVCVNDHDNGKAPCKNPRDNDTGWCWMTPRQIIAIIQSTVYWAFFISNLSCLS